MMATDDGLFCWFAPLFAVFVCAPFGEGGELNSRLTTELRNGTRPGEVEGLAEGLGIGVAPPAPGAVPPAAGLTTAGAPDDDDGAGMAGCPPLLLSLACCGAVVITIEGSGATVETKADMTVLDGNAPAPLVPACGKVGGAVGDTKVVLALEAPAKLALRAAATDADELDKRLQYEEDERTQVQALEICAAPSVHAAASRAGLVPT